MSYVDAYHKKDSDEIHVVERIDGKRVFRTFPANYVFYYDDPRGYYKDMWGRPVSKFQTNNYRSFQKELRMHSRSKIFESDINPVFRCLSENYLGSDTPVLNIGFFDIEVDFDPKRGYASPWDPFSAVTAISVYLTHMERLVTLVIKPELPVNDPHHLSWEKADEICSEFSDCILFNDEADLLLAFLDLIEDCDVLSGWNSKGYDIPYLVNRIDRILGKEYSKRFCLWDQRPKKTRYVQFKQTKYTYSLVGRVHLDYLELYRKHNPQELHSYRLDFVGEIEVGENKVPYEGSLDDLYKKDFKKFIEYNRQDTLLLYKIDQKKRFIELANQIAHTNTVLLPTTMGSVALIEQAIINEAHSKGLCVPNRKTRDVVIPNDDAEEEDLADFDDEDEEEEDKPVVGAYVAVPKEGIHKEVACCDINSLYPSTIRALNMGPETLIGQIRSDKTNALIEQRIKEGVKGSDVWTGVFATLEYDIVQNQSDETITVDFEDGTTLSLTGKELYDYIFSGNNPVCISANGTLFRTDVEGVIPGILSKWYSERKQMQFKEAVFSDISAKTKGFSLDEDVVKNISNSFAESADFNSLADYIKEKDYGKIKFLIDNGQVKLESNKVFATEQTSKRAGELKVFWNQRQQARKILLNSLYGAILNETCRFFDQRIGQSVTLTGRSIAKHMNSKVNEIITGTYQYDGEAVIYADTDSSYFSAYHILEKDPEMRHVLNSRESMIQLYDNIGDEVNSSFPEFMNHAFNTGIERGSIIRAGRELVGSRGLFITKKRYAILMYDIEGTRLDVDNKPGKIKAMGLDLKRSDTPKIMQEFLERILMVLLDGGSKEQILEMIKDFRREFRDLDGWLKGTPKKVNSLTSYTEALGDDSISVDIVKAGPKEKVRVPGHVQAAINWNKLRDMNNDRYSMEIQDGQKVIVCKLKPNMFRMDSVAYPIDEMHLPKWYKELPFDHDAMEGAIIDKKIENLIGVLNWDLSSTRDDSTFDDLFGF